MKDFIVSCIKNARGDDLYRAMLAFGNMSEEELNKEHGQSGRTRREILECYKAYDQKITDALKWLENIK